MSRRTHGLVALLATATLVALLIAWWAPDRDPGDPTTGPTTGPSLPTSSAPSVPTSGSSASSSAASSSTPAPPTASPPVVVPGATISPCRRTGGTVPVTVVTFNIHSGFGRDGLQLAEIAGEIAAVEPDVVLLQEVDQNRLRSRFVDEAAYLATLLGMEHVFASNVERDGLRAGDPVSDYGTAVLTRLRIESWTHTLLPNRPGRQQRGLQHLELRLGGRPISIYNTHLDHTTPSLRQDQMRLARDIIGVDGDPVIFGGDFNATPGSAALRLALDPGHTDLLDPWPLVGDGDGLTVPNYVPRRRVDYLLADDDWRPTVMATWQSAVSDHRGVVGRFLLRSPRVCR
jgi:endonuclease/exonuclease/phosphatase family metal-dependent hydrolase